LRLHCIDKGTFTRQRFRATMAASQLGPST
jgi:hypothetical protein